MLRPPHVSWFALSLFAASPAFAQDSPPEGAVNADNVGDVASGSDIEGTSSGMRLAEGVAFHPYAMVSTAYQSNVFFSDSSDVGGVVDSPLLRVGVGASIQTDNPYRQAAMGSEGEAATRKVAFKGDFNLTWNQYLSSDDNVSEQSDLGAGALIDALFNPDGVINFNIRNGYIRSVTPPRTISPEDVNRHKNELSLIIGVRPGGGAIQGYAGYTWTIDIFERSALSFANRQMHTFGLGAKWQFLPKTQFSLDTSLGFTDPDSAADPTIKSDATIFRAMGGISTLVTSRFGVVLRGGYGGGYYTTGPSYSSYLAHAEGRFAIGPTIRTAFGYAHDFADSVIANFYADHTIYGRLTFQLIGRLTGSVKGEVRFRSYDYSGTGPVMFAGTTFCGNAACTTSDRDDVIGRLDAGVDYQLNRWLFLGANYTFTNDTTDFYIMTPAGMVDQAEFTWHELALVATARF
jgi:hypothetical protein